MNPSKALHLGKIDWTMREIFPTLDTVPVAHHGIDSSLFQISFQGQALESGNWGVPSVIFSKLSAKWISVSEKKETTWNPVVSCSKFVRLEARR